MSPWVVGWAVCGALCLVLATGCSDSTEPHRVVWSGTESFACGAWAPQRPDAEWAMLDVVFRAESEGVPDSVSLAAVVGAGGELIHVFAVPMARFIVRLEAVEQLYPEPVVAALGVPDPDRMEVPVVITYSRAVGADDLTLLESLGAKDISIILTKYVGCVVPDEGIRVIRALPDVAHVGFDSIFCPD